MNPTRRSFIKSAALTAAAFQANSVFSAGTPVKKYVRFRHSGDVVFGELEDGMVYELDAPLLALPQRTGSVYSLEDIELLPPTRPRTVMAVARNYASHLGDENKPEKPELFFKAPACVIAHGEPIVIPQGTTDCHYEGELVVVIGRRASNVSVADAGDYVFGVSCGNDVSARDWQDGDIQWWRAKGSDTFGPYGPVIATGLDYNNLLLTTRVNGEVKQQQNTNEMLYSVAEVLSFTSRFVTLFPGDVIFTGTPGTTSPIKPGDVVEVEIEGIGTLKNPVQ